jgi:hypothetical protein
VIVVSLPPKIVTTNIRERRYEPGSLVNRRPSDVRFGPDKGNKRVVNDDINLVERNAPRIASRDTA